MKKDLYRKVRKSHRICGGKNKWKAVHKLARQAVGSMLHRGEIKPFNPKKIIRREAEMKTMRHARNYGMSEAKIKPCVLGIKP